MLIIYRILINFIFLISPLILIFRLIKKKNISLDLRKNIAFSQKQKKMVN